MNNNINKFYIWSIVVLLVISFSFYYQYTRNNEILVENAKEMTETRVELLNEKINNWLNSRTQLIDDANNYISLNNKSDQEILNYLTILLENNDEFFSVYYGTYQNEMINASGWTMPEDFDLRERPWYKKAINNNDEIIFTEAFINASEDDIIITIASPVYSDKNGSLLGVIAGDVSISTIISHVEGQNTVDEGFFMLIDSENQILAHPDVDYNLKEGLPSLNQKYKENIQRDNLRGIKLKSITENNKEGFLTYTKVNNTDWILASFTPLQNYTESFTQLFRSFLIAFITSLLVVLIFFWLLNKYVFRPLETFNKNISKIDLENNLDYRIPVSDNNNFSYLNKSVNSVLDKAQKYFKELKEKKNSIKHIANHDPLTNLPNRRKFMDKLQKLLDKNCKGAVMLLDLDNFKDINDTMGHTFGDKILVKIADKLKKLKSEEIFISRFGGDEFLILIKDKVDLDKLNEYIEKINKIFEKPVVVEDNSFHIGFSMGISLFPYDSNDINQLIANADMAMYRVKNRSEKKHIYFDHTMTDKLKEEKDIEKILRNALDNDGFVLNFQPQVNLKTKEADAFEALLRLKDYNISPDKFISIAEEKGLINKIGRWVTKKAVKQIAEWNNEGMKEKSISINFSPYQLSDLKYIDFLRKLINRYNIKPSQLEIEITENILLVNKTESVKFLNRLKELGIKIVLDDFGKGYSSFNYLTYIPVDKVKLDKSLNDQFISENNFDTIESLISLIHSLHLEVVAEGIEDEGRRDKLIRGNCDYIQGYIFDKPLKIEELNKVYYKRYL
ncbi:MAG: bifunctional diguanylate cyclase/phosphodiesterase [Bacillota bacterium]